MATSYINLQVKTGEQEREVVLGVLKDLNLTPSQAALELFNYIRLNGKLPDVLTPEPKKITTKKTFVEVKTVSEIMEFLHAND